MVRKTAFLALFLLAGAAFFISCKKEELSSKKEILSFFFEASKNAQLDRNFMGDINGTTLTAEVAFGVDITNLIPTLEISPRATLSPPAGQVTDFTGPVVYTVTAEDGTTKTFSATVTTAAAPYIGSWSGGPIDFGMGLMNVKATITEDGRMTLEFTQILTGELGNNSVKGFFNPISRQDTDIELTQTERWNTTGWVTESASRTIMYHMNTVQNMRLYYCLAFPRTAWCFEMNLSKD